MRTFIVALRDVRDLLNRTDFASAVCGAVVLSAICMSAPGQTPSPSTSESSAPSQNIQATAPLPEASTSAPSPQNGDHRLPSLNPVLSQGAFSVKTVGGEIREDQWKQLLVGKTMYLRTGYQNSNLEFDEHGRLQGHSPQGSFTLSQIQINKVKLSKHKLELQGDRYALHFLGAAPYEDPTTATDRVKITPKRKSVRITFLREEVEKAKKKDKGEDKKQKRPRKAQKIEATADQSSNAASDIGKSANRFDSADGHTDKKVATATSANQASQLLLSALDSVFSIGIDERMIAAMPEFWKLYYKAAAEKTDYRPIDPGVFRQSEVDHKAKLISALDPSSNELAQANGIAGIALYHAVVGSDGKVEEIVAGRPIGFGLDESAEQTIRKATFQPAVKDGKPVPVALDLVVSFRIYSKRTSQPTAADASQKPEAPVLPGPYTVEAETAQTAGQVH